MGVRVYCGRPAPSLWDPMAQPEILAIIPAKGTSNRVPGKNLRTLGNKPLVAWTIEAALGSKLLTRVVLSTESHAVAAVGKAWGVEVVSHPPLDELPEVPDVCLHVLAELDATGYRPDVVVCLLPSSPFRTAQHIDQAVSAHMDSDRAVLSVSQPRHHMGIVFSGCGISRPPAHNGAVLVDSTTHLTHDGFFSPVDALALPMSPISGLDINTEQDFKYAERIAAKMLAVASGARVKYCVDVDGTLCTQRDGDYENAEPIYPVIEKLRALHAEGHEIEIHTARGTITGANWKAVTEHQLAEWGVPYSRLTFGKPAADVYVDDRAKRPEEL